MSRRNPTILQHLGLTGLTTAAPQTLGALRCVPILREGPLSALRLLPGALGEASTPEDAPTGSGPWYQPHGFVALWDEAGGLAAHGAQLMATPPRLQWEGQGQPYTRVPLAHRRYPGGERRLSFLPLPIALEGLLIRQWRGPELAWGIYNQAAWHSERSAAAALSQGHTVNCLDLALRRFEIHGDQVGMALYGAGRLLGITVAPQPEDYQSIHVALLGDLYRSAVLQYGGLYGDVPALASWAPEGKAKTLKDLDGMLSEMKSAWGALEQLEGEPLMGRPVKAKPLYTLGPYTLQRFITELDPAEENAIGEAILRDDGQLEHLQLFPLSRVQTRRAYLLEQLAAEGWHLPSCAARLGASEAELMRRIENAGLGYWFSPHVRAALAREG